MVGSSVEVECEVTDALELEEIAGLLFLEVGLNNRIVEHCEGLRVQQFAEVALVGTRILDGKQRS